ncbi:MAG: helix-turn-helix domain-containing protein [Candidatus Binataceae bacterium]
MNAKEVAEYLGVHKTTIYRLLKEKEIPAFRLGSDWRFNIESIDDWRRAREGKVGEDRDGSADFAGTKKAASSLDAQAGLAVGERSGSGARK